MSIMDVYCENTIALFRCPSAPERISRSALRSVSTLVLLVYFVRSMRDKMLFAGSSSFFFAAMDVATRVGTPERSVGCKSIVSGTRHTGHVTFFPLSGDAATQPYCSMHSRWNTCLHPASAASSASVSSWHKPQ